MKTFKDLKFQKHPMGDGLKAKMNFDNKYGISVVRLRISGANNKTFYGTYTNNNNEWEVAVLKNGTLCYDTPITNDVIGHLTNKQVSDIMIKI